MKAIEDRIPKSLVSALRGAYLVGGAVRDLLRGQSPQDLDVVVPGDGQNWAARLALEVGGHRVTLGKAGFEFDRVVARGLHLDVCRMNGPSIESDLMARDFTINAMAWDFARRRLVDPSEGLADLRLGRIRMVSEAGLGQDPVRLLRAFRLAAVMGMTLEASTRGAVARLSSRIRTAAGERVRHELLLMMSAGDSWKSVEAMADTGLLDALFPELEPTRGCLQGPGHGFDVFRHTLEAYRHLETILKSPEAFFPTWGPILAARVQAADHPLLKLGILLHDIGKPGTRAESGERIAFHGHAAEGCRMAAGISGRLRLTRTETRLLEYLVRHHLQPLYLFREARQNTLTDRAVFRFFRAHDSRVPHLVLHAAADALGKWGHAPDADLMAFLGQLLGSYCDRFLRRGPGKLPLNGNDLMAHFNLPPSPLIGRLLAHLEALQFSGGFTDVGGALAAARIWLQEHEGMDVDEGGSGAKRR